MSYLALLGGFILLFAGGEAMVRGAVGCARRFGLSEVFVGIAIVGCATSAPELFVSVDAAIAGRPSIAVGNVIGSNSANLLLILGAGAAIHAVVCKPAAIRRDAAMVVLGVIATAVLVLAGGAGRLAGMALLACIVAYLALAFYMERRTVRAPVDLGEAATLRPQPVPLLALFLVLGLASLAIGAELLIYGAVTIAESAGLSERVIGVSVVAVGTSLPELATSVIAALRKQSDVAVGNVLGSCVFNVFGILGAAALAMPLAVAPTEFAVDAAVMAFASALVVGLSAFTGGVSRIAGVALLAIYAAYMAVLFWAPGA